jgi:rubrerythrin
MTKTEQNLMDAFAGESQANRKYLAYAKHAEKEGYAQVARLFRAAAEAETVHAHAHLRTLGKIKSTAWRSITRPSTRRPWKRWGTWRRWTIMYARFVAILVKRSPLSDVRFAPRILRFSSRSIKGGQVG